MHCFFLSLLLLISVASHAIAQPTPMVSITLAWDAPTSTGHDGYAVSRKIGQTGVYAELLNCKVGLGVLTCTDGTALLGQVVCYTAALARRSCCGFNEG
jgi:hypothetical protein